MTATSWRVGDRAGRCAYVNSSRTYLSNGSDRAKITMSLGQLLPPCPVCKRNVDRSFVARG